MVDKSNIGKRYEVRDSDEVRMEIVQVLEKGLGRSLTGQELYVAYWLGDCEFETVGVLLDKQMLLLLLIRLNFSLKEN